jgi:uncharacterized protein
VTPRPTRQNNAAELRAFDSTCERLAGFDAGISFEWVEGYLTALATGPQLPPAERWLEAMFADTFARVFADPDDHAQALRALQLRLKVLREQLDPEVLFERPDEIRLDPWMSEWTDADRERLSEGSELDAQAAAAMQTGAAWAEGFIQGYEAFRADWNEPRDEEAAALFAQALEHIAVLRLAADSPPALEHTLRHYPQRPPTREDLLAEACLAAQDLRMFWVDFAPRPETRRVPVVPGRNDPCPCGSGKKYKKCHGA